MAITSNSAKSSRLKRLISGSGGTRDHQEMCIDDIDGKDDHYNQQQQTDGTPINQHHLGIPFMSPGDVGVRSVNVAPGLRSGMGDCSRSIGVDTIQ